MTGDRDVAWKEAALGPESRLESTVDGLQLGPHKAAPVVAGDASRVGQDAVSREVAADAVDVTTEQFEGVSV